MKKVDETKYVPLKENLINVYRVRKVRPNEDDATRAVEVHTIDITQKPSRNTAVRFEDGWHVIGYVPSLVYDRKIQDMIEKWEGRRK